MIDWQQIIGEFGWKVVYDAGRNQVTGPPGQPQIPGHVVELHRRFRVAVEKGRLPEKVSKKWQWPAGSDALKTARSMVAQYVSEKLIEVEEKASKAAKEALARASELKAEAESMLPPQDASAWSEQPGGSFNPYGSEGPSDMSATAQPQDSSLCLIDADALTTTMTRRRLLHQSFQVDRVN